MHENCADVSKSAVFTHVMTENYSSAANSLMTFWPNCWYHGRAIQSSRVTSCDASMSLRKMALFTFAAVTS